jgi:type I restriction enzyme, S subunit
MRQAALRRVGSIIMGQSPPSATYNRAGRGVPFLQGNADFGSKAPSPSTFSTAATKRSRSGDLLLSVRAPVGEINVADQVYGIGRGLCAIRFCRELVNPNFGWYAIRASTWRLRQQCVGSTYDAVSYQDVAGLKIPVTGMDEQRRIADFLDRETAHIDRLIEKKERLIALLEEKRSVLITRAVTKGLDPDVPMKDSGVEWIGEIPAHWEAVNLRRVAELRTGHTPSRSNPEYWQDCTIPWVTLADVWSFRDDRSSFLFDTKERISELGLRNSAAVLLPAGTVLLSRTASVGFSVIAGVDLATTQDFVNWIPGGHVTSEYLLYVFRAMRPEFRRLTMGSTHQTIYMPDVQALSGPLPPLAEQERIVEFIRESLTRLDGLTAHTSHSIRLLKERRSALITAAVTGRIDVEEYEGLHRAPLALEEGQPPDSSTDTADALRETEESLR